MMFLCFKRNLKTRSSILITSGLPLQHLYVGVPDLQKCCFLHYQEVVFILKRSVETIDKI